MKGIKVAVFEAAEGGVADKVNAWLEENAGTDVVDIKLTATGPDQLAVMIVYHPEPTARKTVGFNAGR